MSVTPNVAKVEDVAAFPQAGSAFHYDKAPKGKLR
jgi:hypothetical protein